MQIFVIKLYILKITETRFCVNVEQESGESTIKSTELNATDPKQLMLLTQFGMRR